MYILVKAGASCAHVSAVTHSLVAQYSALGAAHYLGRLRLSLLAAAVRRRTALLRLARTLVSRQARRRAASSTGSGLVGAGWIVQHLLRGRTRCHHTIAARNRVGVTFFGRGGIECRTRDLLEQIAVDRACCGSNQSGGSDNRGCVSWSPRTGSLRACSQYLGGACLRWRVRHLARVAA